MEKRKISNRPAERVEQDDVLSVSALNPDLCDVQGLPLFSALEFVLSIFIFLHFLLMNFSFVAFLKTP